MKVLTFAAGLAAGYVLGAKAGREKYEQIASAARRASSHPTVVQAKEKAQGYLQTGGDAVTAKLDAPGDDASPAIPAVAAVPRRRRAPATPGVASDPLL
jgi:hypothetical protein